MRRLTENEIRKDIEQTLNNEYNIYTQTLDKSEFYRNVTDCIDKYTTTSFSLFALKLVNDKIKGSYNNTLDDIVKDICINLWFTEEKGIIMDWYDFKKNKKSINRYIKVVNNVYNLQLDNAMIDKHTFGYGKNIIGDIQINIYKNNKIRIEKIK